MNTTITTATTQRAVAIALIVSLTLAGCGSPSILVARNLTDATATPVQLAAQPTQVAPQASQTPTGDMAEMTGGAQPPATSTAASGPTNAPTAGPSPTDFVVDWILFGTPTMTPSHSGSQPDTQITSVPSKAPVAATPTFSSTLPPTATRPTALAAASATSGGSAQSAQSTSMTDVGDPVKGKALFNGIGGCNACHDVAQGIIIVGPSLKGVASRAATRKPGMSADAYLHESIMQPNAFVVPGFASGVMLQNLGQLLSTQQINDVVAYLLTLK